MASGRKCLEDILQTSLALAAWQQAQLGVRLGGLALRSVEAHAEAAFVGCLSPTSGSVNKSSWRC